MLHRVVGLHENVLSHGGYLPVESIDRGAPLIFTEEEWMARYDLYTKSRIAFETMVLVFTTALLLYLILTPVIYYSIMALGGVLVVSLYNVAYYLQTRKDIYTGGPSPGIYVNGVQLTMYPIYTSRLFIPWKEMGHVWIKRPRVGDDHLVIGIKGSRGRYKVPGSFLSEQGMNVIRARALEGWTHRDRP